MTPRLDPRLVDLLAQIDAGAVTHEALADMFVEFPEVARGQTRDQVLERLRRSYPTQAELVAWLKRSALQYLMVSAILHGLTPSPPPRQ